MNTDTVKEKFIISKIYGAFYEIYSPTRGFKRAFLKGKLRLSNNENRHPFVVGDKVDAETPNENADWIITGKGERENFLVRKSSNSDAHVLCANVQAVIILVSLADPETKDGFIDRSIAAVFHSRVEPIILFNKTDLVNAEYLLSRETKYQNLGYKTFSISCNDIKSIAGITDYIQNKTSYIVGNSGVGKSTFINLIMNREIQKTNIISESTKKGKHTTTNSSLIILNENTVLIDSPGIKEWGLMHLSVGEMYESFPELMPFQQNCSVSPCCSASDDCQILKGLGTLSEERKKSLDSMIEGLEIPYRIRVGNLKSGKVRRIKKSFR